MTAVFTKLLSMSITAGWIVLVVVLLRLILKKAPKFTHCLLWCIVGLRLIIPFSFESVLSLVPNEAPSPQEIILSAPADNVFIDDTVILDEGAIIDQGVTTAMRMIAVVTDVCAVIWIVGVIVMLIYATVSYLEIRKKVSMSLRVGKSNVYICDNIPSPFILGIIKPKIYLPSYIKKKEIKYVMAHERSHLKRRDHLWKPFAFVILSFYWFNPLIWLGYILLCRDIELACDEKVIKNIGEKEIFSYSEALLNLGVSRLKVAACPLAFGEVSIKSRVKNVLNYKKPMFWIIVVALVAVIVVGICFLTVRPDNGKSDGNKESNNDVKVEQPQKDNAEEKKHEHDYTSEVIKTATCQEVGEVLYKCKECERSYTENTEIAEHAYESKIIKAATCAANGEIKYTCTACGYEFCEKTDIDTSAHNYVERDMLKFTTCLEEGIIEYVCRTCGDKKQNTVPADGHVWDLHTACCIHEGYAEYICRFCKEIKKEQTGAPAHNWQYSTCIKPEYCKDCGLTRGEPDGHTVYGGVCDRCKENIPSVVIKEIRGLDMTIYVKRCDSEVYFTNGHVERNDSGLPEIWFTISGNNTEYIHKVWYNVTVTNAKTGEVVSDGISFTDVMPGEVRESCSAMYYYLPPGEYIVTISNHAEWNEGIDD